MTYNGNLDYTITALGKGGMTADEITQIELGVNPNLVDYVDYVAPVEGGEGEGATPTSEWLKADIVQWLADHGVTMSESALMALTKAELLDLVEDLLSNP